ncbi:MAG: HAD family phosphatase [Acidobacteria bacterium]|nr:HAD family phosphatase [Acidobacteriota bacterium]
MTETPRCLYLDLGRVIIDIDPRRFAANMLNLAGVGREQLQAVFLDEGLAHRFESGAMTDEEFHQEACRRIGRAISWPDFLSAWNSIILPHTILPEDLVLRISRKIPLWAISNTNSIHFNYIRQHFPILDHFSGFVVSHEVGALKPDPQIFLAALNKAGVQAEEALFTDDQEENVEAARRLGIRTFRFQDPSHFVAELQRRGILE